MCQRQNHHFGLIIPKKTNRFSTVHFPSAWNAAVTGCWMHFRCPISTTTTFTIQKYIFGTLHIANVAWLWLDFKLRYVAVGLTESRWIELRNVWQRKRFIGLLQQARVSVPNLFHRVDAIVVATARPGTIVSIVVDYHNNGIPFRKYVTRTLGYEHIRAEEEANLCVCILRCRDEAIYHSGFSNATNDQQVLASHSRDVHRRFVLQSLSP